MKQWCRPSMMWVNWLCSVYGIYKTVMAQHYTLHAGIIISDHPCFAGLCFCELRQTLKSCNEQNIWVWEVFGHCIKCEHLKHLALVVSDVKCVHFCLICRVHGPEDSQETVFEEVKPLLTSLLDGWVSYLIKTNLTIHLGKML